MKFGILPPDLIKKYNKLRSYQKDHLCYAPFNNLYFGSGGKVTACCYNQTHILGKYPKDSITEIWTGKKVKELRDAISTNSLETGCQLCKTQLIAENFDGTKAKEFDFHGENSNSYPTNIQFELSNICNLECEMCTGEFSSLIRKNREKLPPIPDAYNGSFLLQLEGILPNIRNAQFFGGEPFLIDIYFKIWEKIIEINPRIQIAIQTNGTILNKRVESIFQRSPFDISISLESLHKEPYERIRKNASFYRTRENIKWFRNYAQTKGTFFGISVCALNNNWKEYPEFIDFVNSIEAPIYFHTITQPKHLSYSNLEKKELELIIQFLKKYSPPETTPIEKKNSTHYRDLIKQIEFYHYQKDFGFTKPESLQNFKELINFYMKFIQNDPDCAQPEKDQIKISLQTKLNQMEKILEGKISIKTILSKFNLNDYPTVWGSIQQILNHSIQELEDLVREKIERDHS
jgi:MoaA/NifB/PqqE/SkfB family radical SAM enzyme